MVKCLIGDATSEIVLCQFSTFFSTVLLSSENLILSSWIVLMGTYFRQKKLNYCVL